MYNNVQNPEIIPTLYRLACQANAGADIVDWYEKNAQEYTEASVRRTLAQAKKSDIADILIPSSDISVGDSVKSKNTARTGKVKDIRSDGSTVVVRWDQGGVQLISKEALVIIHNKENTQDFEKTTTVSDPYAGMDNKNVLERPKDETRS